jgi:Secretion system C-terminal sorting domain
MCFLSQNYPNPFNPSTLIRYQVAHTGSVRLNVYDVLGREVATLVNDVKPAGFYSATFNGANILSGVYFYRLQTASFTETICGAQITSQWSAQYNIMSISME